MLAKILDTLAFIFIFFLTSKTYLMISCAKNKLGQIQTTAVRRELRGGGVRAGTGLCTPDFTYAFKAVRSFAEDPGRRGPRRGN